MKRRRVGNLLALAVLAVLTERPCHPYEMAAVLRARGKDQDMPIKWGSLYTVVRNLDRHGLIEVAESTRDGARPERTVYRITDDGRAELTDWVRELIAVPEPERPRFKAGLSLLAAIDPDEAADLLRHRLDDLERRLAAAREAMARDAATIPRLLLIEDEYDLALQAAEANWVRGVLAELTDGTFPGLDVWRGFHRTGGLPEEIRTLMEGGRPGD